MVDKGELEEAKIFLKLLKSILVHQMLFSHYPNLKKSNNDSFKKNLFSDDLLKNQNELTKQIYFLLGQTSIILKKILMIVKRT